MEEFDVSGDPQLLGLGGDSMDIEGSPDGIEAAAREVFDESMEPTDQFDGGFGEDDDEEVKSEVSAPSLTYSE